MQIQITPKFLPVKYRWFFAICCALLFVTVRPQSTQAMSATNIQPSNLVISNRTRVTVTFTTAATLPTNGKIKVVFPSGFGVASATGGTCTGVNGGLATSISGQTVILARDGAGTPILAGAQTCTLDGLTNPVATGTTGVYSIAITDSADTVLDQDAAVVADTVISPGVLVTTNVQPENQVANVRSRSTVSFTTVNSLQIDGRIKVTYPSGFDVSAANSGACSSMDGGFTTATSGQSVILTRNGNGTIQAAAAETCFIDGVVSPATGTAGVYAIETQDASGNPTDVNLSVTGDAFFPSGVLAATNVQPASLIAGAIGTVTMTFTTVTSTPIRAKIRVVFPSGFDLSAAGTAACASLSGAVTNATSGQTLIISRTGSGSTEAPGVESCTLTNVRNPRVSGPAGAYSIEVIDDQVVPALVASDMAVASDTVTPGALAATNVQPENLVIGITSVQTVTFTTANPIPADGRVAVTFPGGFSVTSSNSAMCAVMDGTFLTSVSGSTVVITRVGTTAVAAGNAITCTIKDIRAPAAAGAAGAYALQLQNASGTVIDSGAPTSDTFVVAPALTVADVQPVSLVRGILSDVAIGYTIAQNIPAEGKVKVTFGAGFDISAAASGTCTGFDGTVTTTVAGQIVVMSRGGNSTTNSAAAKTCRLYGIKNPPAAGSTGTYTITVTDKADAVVASLATVTADTIVVPGALTGTDIQPASLVAGSSGQVTILFSAVNGIPTGGKIKAVFPSGFDVSSATGANCVGLSGSVSVQTGGQTFAQALGS